MKTGSRTPSGHWTSASDSVLRTVRWLSFLFVGLTCLPQLWAGFDYREIKNGVVRIVVLHGEKEPEANRSISVGSGFVISSQGHIVTSQHLVDRPGRILAMQLRERQARQQHDEIKVWSVGATVYLSGEKDVAVLLVPELGGRPIRLAKEDTNPGDEIMTVGFPGMADTIEEREALVLQLFSRNFRGLRADDDYVNCVRPSVIRGNVEDVRMQSDWGRDEDSRVLVVRHNAPTASGNSGGALLNDRNEVIGVHTASDAEARDTNTRASQGKQVGQGLAVSELKAVLDGIGIPYNEFPATQSAEAGAPATRIVSGPANVIAGSLHGGRILSFVMAGVAVVLVVVAVKVAQGGGSVQAAMQQASAGSVAGGRVLEDATTVLAPTQRTRKMPDDRRSQPPLGSFLAVDENGARYVLRFFASDFSQSEHTLAIGRTERHAVLALPHHSVSRVHASLRYQPSTHQFSLRDEDSANGCTINGRSISSQDGFVDIRAGDSLKLGKVKLRFQLT